MVAAVGNLMFREMGRLLFSWVRWRVFDGRASGWRGSWVRWRVFDGRASGWRGRVSRVVLIVDRVLWLVKALGKKLEVRGGDAGGKLDLAMHLD
ncbi:hypothetical protein K458DRAFT_198739 [Lentithecium fluviatile CBS 122367]|uniref:Uncharacterized protein n=1 Tax=Lentithecium fluviatile CBS 122367 TaxID=1168545 RepID=A0A6G1J7J3_9PLEO|nr:hypothetical protein K458DRAFT_198739 [Lentithecium fluviatile CBS 122367]